MDFQTYLASESSAEDEDELDASDDGIDLKNRRNKYKALLDAFDDDVSNPFGRPKKFKDEDNGMGDMEVTFTPGISANKDDSEMVRFTWLCNACLCNTSDLVHI